MKIKSYLQVNNPFRFPFLDAFFFQIASDGTTFFTGSWDKNIKAVKFAGEDGLETWADGIKLEAHADFVKTLATLSPLQLLISGGADKLIRIWNYNRYF